MGDAVIVKKLDPTEPNNSELDLALASLADLQIKLDALTEDKRKRSSILRTYMVENKKFVIDPKTQGLRYENDLHKVVHVAATESRVFHAVNESLAISLRDAKSRQMPPRDLILVASEFNSGRVDAMIAQGRLERSEAALLYETQPTEEYQLRVEGLTGADSSLVEGEDEVSSSNAPLFRDMDDEIARIIEMSAEIDELEKRVDTIRENIKEIMIVFSLSDYVTSGGCHAKIYKVTRGGTFLPPLRVKKDQKLTWSKLSRLVNLSSKAVTRAVKTGDISQEDADAYFVNGKQSRSAHLRFYRK